MVAIKHDTYIDREWKGKGLFDVECCDIQEPCFHIIVRDEHHARTIPSRDDICMIDDPRALIGDKATVRQATVQPLQYIVA